MEAVIALLWHLSDEAFWDKNEIIIKIITIYTIFIFFVFWLVMTRINGVLPK